MSWAYFQVSLSKKTKFPSRAGKKKQSFACPLQKQQSISEIFQF